MPSVVSEARAIKSSSAASTASLRSRDGTLPSFAKTAAKMNEASEDNIQVMVRVRRFVPRELERNAKCLVEMFPDGATILNPPDSASGGSATSRARQSTQGPKRFNFDRAFWSHDESSPGVRYADQETVYSSLGERLLDANFEGYNTCIFAYGQTGSGKSYTMMGRSHDPEHRGIIPRVCQDMFERIRDHQVSNKTASYDVEVSYFEIYNEKAYDLLISGSSSPRAPLQLETDPATKTARVKGVITEKVKSFGDIEALFERGDRNRTTASTKMNDTSSRSHAVFTIKLKGIAEVDGKQEKRESHMRLVDLAGSERASSTGATGARLVEGSNINKSLSTLGRVIKALADNASKKRGNTLVPYRDSVLTRILQNSLGGNSKTAMIACIAPSDYDETMSTLRWASETKKIRTRATQNQTSQSSAERDAAIAALSAEVRRLQSSLVEGAKVSERSVREHERSVLEQEQRIAEYQRQVNAVTQAMEEKAVISDKKIIALQEENETLRAHLKLALEALKNPLPAFPAPREVDVEEDEEDGKNEEGEDIDEAYFEGSDGEGQLKDQDDEMDSVMSQLLGDIALFRRKLGDDLDRFHVPDMHAPAGVHVI